jgi:hypothetical protein
MFTDWKDSVVESDEMSRSQGLQAINSMSKKPPHNFRLIRSTVLSPSSVSLQQQRDPDFDTAEPTELLRRQRVQAEPSTIQVSATQQRQ